MKKWGFGISGFAYHNVTDGSFAQAGIGFGYRMVPREAIRCKSNPRIAPTYLDSINLFEITCIRVAIYNFVNGEKGIASGLVDSILQRLREIRSWFERQKRFQFYDSSILVTYDAKRLAEAVTRGEQTSFCEAVPAQVIMIDFDKVVSAEADRRDENYLSGLRNIIFIFEILSTMYAGCGS